MKECILIVEDEPFVSRILQNRMVRLGYDVKCVDNTGSAIGVTLQRAPDLMVLDLNLIHQGSLDGIRDGLGFLEWLHQNMPDADFPIIIYSSAPHQVAKRSLPKNVYSVLKKQKDLAVLFLTMRKALDERRAA
jgi:CheY-like chemotaxis protein